MALYIPASRRRRNAAIVAVATLIIGAVFGYVAGRQGVPSVADEVRSTRAQATFIAQELDRLPIEYAKSSAGGDAMKLAVSDPLTAVRTDATKAFESAPWIGDGPRATALDAIVTLQQAVAKHASTDEFQRDVTAASSAIRSAFSVQ